MNRPRVAFETLGCKLNQYETDAIAAGFQDLGWEIVDAREPAEAYIVNTCTVTNKADRKSRNTLGHHLGLPGAPIVVVTGCFAESARESLEGKDGVTFVVPNGAKNSIAALVDGHFRGEVPGPGVPEPDPFAFPVHDRVFHTRASLKIQDGCDNFCTFCIIPTVRGRAVSRPLPQVLDAARKLVKAGRKELVLTGVNLGRWRDGPATFTDLVAALLDLEGDFRLRITSLEPEGLGEAFVNLAAHPKFCPHLHLCLQSGSPRILLAMRREYTLDQYQTLVDRLRSRVPGLNLTTDLIVGFPGETDEDFHRTLGAAEAFGFGAVHVFPFSRRQGTRADRMADQVPPGVKDRRVTELQDWAAHQRRRVMEALSGQVRRVLVETLDQGRTAETRLKGLTEDYFPVRFRGTARWNTFARVRLGAVVTEGDDLVLEAEELV
jgi:threonylcarbamoyladenosine tRNA methylthiotransferase MtaB